MAISELSFPNFPATECILVVSRLSPNERGGRMLGMHFAIMDFPLPGEPIIIRLCPPDAATSNARFYTFLSFHISKIVWKATLVFIEFLPCIDDARLQIAFIIEKFDDLFDIFYAIYFQVVYYSSFPRIFVWGSMKPSKTLLAGTDSYGEGSFDWLKASIQAKFSDNKIT